MQFTWTMGRRLSSATSSGGTKITYTYNAEGLRTGKNVNGIQYDYYWNGDKLTYQTDGANTWYSRYDGDTPISLEFDGVEYYYVTNLQGDVIAILNDSGECVAEYSYDAWGNCTITKNTNTIANLNPLRYRGYYYDSDTGLYYLQSRYYDSQIGRFINADEPTLIGANGGMVSNNLFAYCDNNPVNCVDYDGYSTKYVNDRKLRDGMGLSSFWTRAKSIYTLSSCLNKIAKYHDWIMKCARNFKIPGEMIMAILYREMTCYGYDDPIADAAVIRYYTIGKWAGGKSDSSTGLAQITATTAIAAEKYLDYNRTRDMWTMWKYLRNDFYCAMVLRYEAEKRGLKYGIYRKNYDFIQKVFAGYNGSSGYGKAVIKIYKQFLKY